MKDRDDTKISDLGISLTWLLSPEFNDSGRGVGGTVRNEKSRRYMACEELTDYLVCEVQQGGGYVRD